MSLFRSCRYQKCISVGMNPLLVDSCKNSKTTHDVDVEDTLKSSTSITPKVELEDLAKEPLISYFHDEALKKDKLLKAYEETYKEVMLDPNGIYIKSQIFLEEEMFSQMIQKRPKLKMDALYYENLKRIVYQIVKKFLSKHIGTSLNKDKLQLISEKSYMAMFSLFQALENCFKHKNVLEQFYHSYHFPQAVLDFFKAKFPYTEHLLPYRSEDFEIMTAPVTPNQEDDFFLGSTYRKIFEMIEGDTELGRIYAMLVMFSPSGVILTNEESIILKQFQSQVSIIMFNHILSKDKETIVTASKKSSDLVSIVKDLYRCGYILTNMTFVSNDNHWDDIDNISVTQIL